MGPRFEVVERFRPFELVSPGFETVRADTTPGFQRSGWSPPAPFVAVEAVAAPGDVAVGAHQHEAALVGGDGGACDVFDDGQRHAAGQLRLDEPRGAGVREYADRARAPLPRVDGVEHDRIPGQQHAHVDAEPLQREGQRPADVAEAPGLDQRRDLGRGEQHAGRAIGHPGQAVPRRIALIRSTPCARTARACARC